MICDCEECEILKKAQFRHENDLDKLYETAKKSWEKSGVIQVAINELSLLRTNLEMLVDVKESDFYSPIITAKVIRYLLDEQIRRIQNNLKEAV